jgi:PAS domain S-box-containing protein
MAAKPAQNLKFPSLRHVKRTLFRYAICLSFLIVPAALTLLLRSRGPDFGPIISASFVLAVAAAGWWGGAIAGILVTFATVPVLTEIATRGKLFLPPRLDPAALFVLCAIAFLVSQVASSRRRAEEVLRSVNDELEKRVKERTAELENARNWLETTLSSIGDAVIATDHEGNLLFLNGAAEALTGWTQQEAYGRPLGEVFVIRNEQTLNPVEDPVSRVLTTGAICGLANHTVLVSRDGHIVPIDDSAAPIQGKGGSITGVVLVFRDVTERREAERSTEHARQQLERNNQELQQFAYAASHDLQEPLRNIAIYTQLLERRYSKHLDADAGQIVHHIVDGAARMSALVRDLLSYTQVWGATAEEILETDLREVLEAVISSLDATIAAADARIDYGELPVLQMNEVHLQQLLQNLIGNALKYRSEQAPFIRVDAEPSSGKWTIRVADNGIGIDPLHKDRIFEPFKRLHSNEKYPGTGIGLALCQKIVQRYGGHIWVESELGKGSTFCFTVPVARAQHHQSAAGLSGMGVS